MIKIEQLIQILDNNADLLLYVMLPSGEFVPEHFHITEVGKIQKSFIDCGGTLRETSMCSLQVWTANDFNHRLKSDKLSKILKLAKDTLNLNDLPIEIEYGENVVSQYSLSNIEITPSGLLFVLSGKKTNCLALDKCGINSGCC